MTFQDCDHDNKKGRRENVLIETSIQPLLSSVRFKQKYHSFEVTKDNHFQRYIHSPPCFLSREMENLGNELIKFYKKRKKILYPHMYFRYSFCAENKVWNKKITEDPYIYFI